MAQTHSETIADLMAQIDALRSKVVALSSAPAAPAAPAAASYAVGTKLRWEMDDSSYRVAIIITQGVLQVKEVSSLGVATTTKKLFKNFDDWMQELPPNGKINVCYPQPRLTSVEHKLRSCYAGCSDAELVKNLSTVWKTNSYVYPKRSFAEELTANKYHYDMICKELAEITEEEDLKSPLTRRRLTNSLGKLCKRMAALKLRCSTMSYNQLNEKPWAIINYSGNTLLASYGNGMEAIAEKDGYIIFKGVRAKTFLELGVTIDNGVPLLLANYRRKRIYLWESKSMIEWGASR